MAERLTPLPPVVAGQSAFCGVTGAPMPNGADMHAAVTSPSERRRVDLMYAAACGIEGDAVEPFLERLALYDLRESARQQEDALERARVAYATRVEVESRGELVRMRGRRLMRLAPRKVEPV